MQRSSSRIVTCLSLTGLVFLLAAGCQSEKMGDKPGDEFNSAMSAQQKAILTEHKKKADQELK